MAIKVFVDQGHNPGTINAGASANGVVEADVNYWVGVYLAGFLYVDPRFEVRVSRTYPDTVIGYDQASSLTQRVEMANSWPADYFISIHCNANENTSINGTEAYVYTLPSVAGQLAQSIVDSIVYYVGTKDNFVRVNANLYVLRNTSMPAVLVELAYLTNPEDAIKLQNDQYTFAFAIYMGLLNDLGLAYPGDENV